MYLFNKSFAFLIFSTILPLRHEQNINLYQICQIEIAILSFSTHNNSREQLLIIIFNAIALKDYLCDFDIISLSSTQYEMSYDRFS